MNRAMWKQLPLGALFPLAALGCNDALVGGACLDGFVQRGRDCVESPHDTSSVTLSGGAGGTGPTGGPGGGGNAGGSGESTVTSTTTASGNPTGQGGAGGEGSCGGALSVCVGYCVDLASDPQNCGECGHACATAACTAGECDGAVAGHVVVLGLDYDQVAAGSPPARLLGNAAFLSTHSPLRVLDYRAPSDPASAAHVQALLTSEAVFRGRSITVNQVSSTPSVTQELNVFKTDVFVLHVPMNADVEDMGIIASQWAGPLEAFEKHGGVVVTLVGASAPGSVSAVLDQTALFPDVSCGGQASGPYHVAAFLDSIATGIPSSFGAPGLGVSLTFTGSVSPMVSIPVVDQLDAPIALHRVILPAN